VAYDEALADRIRSALGRRKHLVEKKMFGGVGFLLNGNLCVGVWKNSLVVRLGREEGEASLREDHVRTFDITGKPMAGWVLVGAAASATDEQVQDWVGRCVRFNETLPAK
jgi:hypothetical protein